MFKENVYNIFDELKISKIKNYIQTLRKLNKKIISKIITERHLDK